MKRLPAALLLAALLGPPSIAFANPSPCPTPTPAATAPPTSKPDEYAAAHEPCGFVEFTNIQLPVIIRGAFYQDIRLTVHFGDGSVLQHDLDYPFYYPNEDAFPWSYRNIRKDEFPVDFQFPPDDKRASEPPAVQYIMRHSTPEGVTNLKKCLR